MSSNHHRTYGLSYIELKNDVRLRCTFGHGDSGGSEHCIDDLAVCEAYAHIMVSYKPFKCDWGNFRITSTD